MTKHTHHEIGDHAACIRLVPIFNHLEDSAMNYIAEKAHTKQYQKGEFLFRSQEKEDTLYIINRGKIRIYRLADSGKEQLVRILNPGDFTGEWTLFNPDGSTRGICRSNPRYRCLYDSAKRCPRFFGTIPSYFFKTIGGNV